MRRPGTITPFLIVSLTAFLLLFALAVNAAWLWTARGEVQASADAAALAAAQELVTDQTLRNQGDDHANALQSARVRATAQAAKNPVRGRPLVLEASDIALGTLSQPRSTLTLDPPQVTSINSVIVTGRLTKSRGTAPGMIFGQFAGRGASDLQARSTAYVDRDVYGIRPLYGSAPLASLALFGGSDLRSWAFQVESSSGADSNGDGLREFTGIIPLKPEQLPLAGVALVYYTGVTPSDAAHVLTTGVTRDDLLPLGGQVALGTDGQTLVPGQNLGPAFGTPDLAALVSALQTLKTSGEVRVWPLYQAASASRVKLTGFVAGKVLAVIPPPDQNTPLIVRVQEAALLAPFALTDAGRRNVVPQNRYIAKVRLAD